jgi:hypothetical protein
MTAEARANCCLHDIRYKLQHQTQAILDGKESIGLNHISDFIDIGFLRFPNFSDLARSVEENILCDCSPPVALPFTDSHDVDLQSRLRKRLG